MLIMKFGGSSLQSPERIRETAAIVQNHASLRPMLVLSAMGSTTENLIDAGRSALHQSVNFPKIEEFHRGLLAALNLPPKLVDPLLSELNSLLRGISLIRELTPKTRDTLLSFGERLSVRIFSAYLNQIGVPSSYFDGWDAGILTTSDHGKAEVLPETSERIQENLNGETKVAVVTGFIGKDRQGNITTLGRGGSDLTASILGQALGADEIQLWKDVDGILSADPRIVPNAAFLPQLSFAEAAELAYFGAKVLHPTSILPAMSANIPVRVKNHRHPDNPGTVILESGNTNSRVVAIAYKSNQTLVHIASTRMLGQSGFLARVFQVFSDLNISVDVIATSEVSISLTLSGMDLSQLRERIEPFATVQIQGSKSILSLIGKPNSSSEHLETMMRALNREKIDVQMISHGASKINTSLVINDDELNRATTVLYEAFIGERS